MSPFWTAILARFVLRERIQLVEVLGIFVCFGGVTMIAISKSHTADEEESEEDI